MNPLLAIGLIGAIVIASFVLAAVVVADRADRAAAKALAKRMAEAREYKAMLAEFERGAPR